MVVANAELHANSQADEDRYRQIRLVLLRVLFLNLLLAAAKVIVGVLTGALAMVADGIHSIMDASSNVIAIVASAISARPADESHPYGHRRFETMATLTIGGLLLLAAWEILQTAIQRLLNGSPMTVTTASFVVMIGTVIIKLVSSAYEATRGKTLRSDLLQTDATEGRTDLIISLSVIAGLAASALGFAWMDTVIALLIVGVIGWTAFNILGKSTQVLVDRAAVDPDEIRRVVAGVPGIDQILRVRSRGPADTIYADIDVQVQPATTADRAAAIADEIGDRVKAAFSGVTEVQVHFAPHHDHPQDYALVARAAADALGLSVHEITQILTSEGIILEMHVEVSPTLTLAEAHKQVSELEKRVRAGVPGIADVLTHIEPASGQAGAVIQTARAVALRDQALAIARKLYPDAHWHDATIRPVMGGYAMTLHCWLPGNVSVQEAHAIAEQVETEIRAALPQVQRVTIHTEPPEESPTEDKAAQPAV